MIRFPMWRVAILAGLAGCGDAVPKTPEAAQVFPNLPLPPQPSFVSRAGGVDALQITLRSPAGVDQIADYYRGVFRSGVWRLVKDDTDRNGVVVLYAEQNGPPLWVRIRKSDDGIGSLVDLTGAVIAPDSTRAAPLRDSAKATS